MANNGINFSGLASNVQWGEIVDSTIKALEARTVKPISDKITQRDAQRDAWKKLQGLVESLSDASRAIRRAGFSGFTTTVPTSPTSSRALLSATASGTAVPGTYRVEVAQLADTAKIGGSRVADSGAALGLTGTFGLNGSTITIAATDSLQAIRTKINTANSGATATGVTATIVSDGGTAGRLVLTRDTAGDGSIAITDGTGGMARELGLIDSRTKPLSSETMAAAALGLPSTPPPASIRVGGQVISIDLSVDSLASIAAKINAAGGSAAIESVPFGNQTRYLLQMDGNVAALDGDADSAAVVAYLETNFGVQAGTTSAVRQTVQSGAFTSAADSTATTATGLAGLKLNGTSANLAVGDAINIRGTRGDGSAVTIGLVVQSGDTMQTLLDRINDTSSGFGSGSRPGTASLGADGRMRLTDGTGGLSRLSMSMSIVRADGTTGTLGSSTVSVTGRARELQVGRDAIVQIDGQEFRRTSNVITDAISGVTLSLQNAEPGTAIDVKIERDLQGGQNAMQKFVDGYNAIRTFFDEQRKEGAPLYADSLLRKTVESFTGALRTDVSANGTYPRLAVAGVALDRNGILKLDADTFRTALTNKPAEIEALLGFSGVGSAMVAATDSVTAFSTGLFDRQIRTINESQATLRRRESDAISRLERRREQLVQQYTRMEEAMSKANAQGSIFKSLQKSD